MTIRLNHAICPDCGKDTTHDQLERIGCCEACDQYYRDSDLAYSKHLEEQQDQHIAMLDSLEREREWRDE